MGDIEQETDRSNLHGGHFADAISVTGYKWLCGSFGSGFMWCGKTLLESGNLNGHRVEKKDGSSNMSPSITAKNTYQYDMSGFSPGLVGFRSHYDMWATDVTKLEYPLGAKRFEFATLHFGAIQGLSKCCELINKMESYDADSQQTICGTKAVYAHNLYLCDYFIAGLERRGLSPGKCEVVWAPGNMTVSSPVLGYTPTFGKSQNLNAGKSLSSQVISRSSIVSLRLKGLKDSGTVADELKHKHGVIVTKRGVFLRVSPHYYNGTRCLDRLMDAMEVVL